MKVLVIGGTGFIGRHVVRKLLERGNDVSILARGKTKPDPWTRIETIVGDRSDKSALRDLLKVARLMR